MKKLILTLLALSATAILANQKDCQEFAEEMTDTLHKTPERVLEIVSLKVEASPECACEIVKQAILDTEAPKESVQNIVEVAIIAAPDQMRLISQCAIAIAPDSIKEVQRVLAKFTPQAGESYSAKAMMYSTKNSSKNPSSGIASQGAQNVETVNPLEGPAFVGLNAETIGEEPFVAVQTVEDPSAQ